MDQATSDDELLTESAKRAVRAYMLKLVAPSAVVLSVVSAIIGYIAHGLGESEALKAMLGEVAAPVIASEVDPAVWTVERLF